MSCNHCGSTSNICNCSTTGFSSNWFNPQTCNPCTTSDVCKQQINAKCIIYKGPNLANIGLASGVNIELILSSLDQSIGASTGATSLDKAAILTILNDINARINTLAGGTPRPPYTL